MPKDFFPVTDVKVRVRFRRKHSINYLYELKILTRIGKYVCVCVHASTPIVASAYTVCTSEEKAE